jgi:hypothetical protein
VHRPRVRSFDGDEVALPSWTAAQAEDWLGRWAMNLMLINVSTRKLRRAVRLPEGDLPIMTGDGTSKSAASRRFVALSAERLAEWMVSDLSKLDLLMEVSKILGLTGKPQGIDGSRVEEMVLAGQIEEVARYCESDVLNTFRVWLVYELFRGAITKQQLEWSEGQIREFVANRKTANRHLCAAMGIVDLTN